MIGKLLDTAASLCIPQYWFRGIRNHTAAVLLADILSSYQDTAEGMGQEPVMMDGDELILEYRALARRLGLSTRSVSRGIDHLVGLKAVRRSRRDRTINGRLTRNVVGVLPNLPVICKLSGVVYGDILSAPRAAQPAGRAGSPSRVRLAKADALVYDLVPLTPSQESLIRAFQDDFQEILGRAYGPSPDQRQADLRAAALVKPAKARGGGRKYVIWARQYLNALKDQAEKEHEDVQQAIVGRDGFVRPAYTLERFLEWAQSEDLLPTGFLRRRM